MYTVYMPELPEVETVKLGLKNLLVGRKLAGIKVLSPKSFQASESDVDNFLLRSRFVDVKRLGKALVLELDSDYCLAVHLKMTGQLVFVPGLESSEARWGAGHPNSSFFDKLPDSSTRIIFELDDGSRLYFNDQRKFGWVKLLPKSLVADLEFIKKLGPDSLEISSDDFVARLDGRQKSIKACLLDQSIVAGIGNIYADESLWAAEVHPMTRANQLSSGKLTEIIEAAKEVMLLSLAKGGSSSRNYVNAEGKMGSYLEFANVYQRAGQDCRRCGALVERIVVAGRGTHICPSCQKAPSS